MKEKNKKKKGKVCRFQKKPYLCIAFGKESLLKKEFGEVAEWSIAAVLKTVVLRGTRGSNPCLSATNAENQQIAKQTPSFTPKNVKSVFLFYLR